MTITKTKHVPFNVTKHQTQTCFYGSMHSRDKALVRPACKEAPKILMKSALQDVFLSVRENEPLAFKALQVLFGGVKMPPVSGF